MNDTERQCIDLLLDGDLPEAETFDLLARLEGDPDAIVYFAERALLHSELRDSLKRRQLQRWATATVPSLGRPTMNAGKPVASSSRSWFAGHPLSTATMGLVLGLFSASLVFGYVMPRIGKAVKLLHESFESNSLPSMIGMPTKTGEWGGDAAEIVASDGTLKAKDGVRVLRLEPMSSELWNRQYLIVDLSELPDLQEDRSRVVRVTASFHASTSDIRDRYLLRAATFADGPESIKPEWLTTLWGSEENPALTTAAKALTFLPDSTGWKTLQLTLDVPQGSRVLVLSFWAATMTNDADLRAAHFLDDVRVVYETLPSAP
jgi:hypothetical protein